MIFPVNHRQPSNGNSFTFTHLNSSVTDQDVYWMNRALVMAEQGRAMGEVPVGAVLVADNELLAEGWNQPIKTSDPTAHAEIVVMREAAKKIKNYRLLDSTLYITLEPCVMCAGAIVHARISRVVYGATDPKAGAVESVFAVLSTEMLNHQPKVTRGVLEDKCSAQLKSFFRERRS